MTLKSDAELECSAYGVPTPTIQWFKNGEPIYPSEYFQLNSHTGSLRILGIIAQDEGYYQCLASNELNTIQAVAQLVVHVNENDMVDDDYNNHHHNQIIPAEEYEDLATRKTQLATSKAPIYPSSTHPIVHLSSPSQLRLIK